MPIVVFFRFAFRVPHVLHPQVRWKCRSATLTCRRGAFVQCVLSCVRLFLFSRSLCLVSCSSFCCVRCNLGSSRRCPCTAVLDCDEVVLPSRLVHSLLFSVFFRLPDGQATQGSRGKDSSRLLARRQRSRPDKKFPTTDSVSERSPGRESG